MAKEKILLVEDEDDILELYESQLSEKGYKTKTAKDGREGLKAVAVFKPDIILLDIRMPVMDGYEMLKELKKDKKTDKISVLMLTNLGNKEEIDKVLELGADGYLIKVHFTPEEVIKKIESLKNSK